MIFVRCVTSAARRMTNLLTHSPPLIHKWFLTKKIQKNRQVGLREKEPERCCVCESEEGCSTAAVPVTALVRLNTPIQSISLHSSFAHPSIHTIKAVGMVGKRERRYDRESICFCRKRRGEGAEEEEERERIVPSEKNEELQREREGREEVVVLQRHAVKSSSIIGTDSRHQRSADIIGQQ